MLHLQLKFCDGKPADNVAAETVAESELWSLFMTLESLCEPAAIHNDNVGILDGLWKGEEGGRGSKHWHLLEEADKKDVPPDVKHVKAHRTQKENNDCKSQQFDVDQ